MRGNDVACNICLALDGGLALNCGFNRVRFVAPVRVGTRVRAAAMLVGVRVLGGAGGAGAAGPAGVETVVAVTVEAEGGGKPVLVAEWVTRQYAKQ